MFGDLVRMPPERLLLEMYQAHPTFGDPGADPGHTGENIISVLAWEHLGNPKEELEDFARGGGGSMSAGMDRGLRNKTANESMQKDSLPHQTFTKLHI